MLKVAMYFADAFLLLSLFGIASEVGGRILRDLTNARDTSGADRKQLRVRAFVQIGEFTVCLHWSVFVVVVCFVIGLTHDYMEWSHFSLFSIACMVSVLLLLAHELGHALACRLVGAKVYGVFVSYSGGVCYTEGTDNRLKAILIYASGPFVNLCVLVIALLVLPEPRSNIDFAIWWALVPFNVYLIVWNLIPRTFGEISTDGFHILHHILNYRVPMTAPPQLEHQTQ